jgi:predicted nucleic acid-binding protein
MPARILDISDQNIGFPDFIVLDTSIVLELTPNPSSPHPHHDLAVNIFNRLSPLAQQGQIILLLPLLAFEECLFKLCQRDIQARSQSQARWLDFYKRDPQVILHSQQTINHFCTILRAFPIDIVEPEDLTIPRIETLPKLQDRMVEMLFNFRVLPKDATILSTAERLGIDTVITLDQDFKRADGFTIITVL